MIQPYRNVIVIGAIHIFKHPHKIRLIVGSVGCGKLVAARPLGGRYSPSLGVQQALERFHFPTYCEKLIRSSILKQPL